MQVRIRRWKRAGLLDVDQWPRFREYVSQPTSACPITMIGPLAVGNVLPAGPAEYYVHIFLPEFFACTRVLLPLRDSERSHGRIVDLYPTRRGEAAST